MRQYCTSFVVSFANYRFYEHAESFQRVIQFSIMECEFIENNAIISNIHIETIFF